MGTSGWRRVPVTARCWQIFGNNALHSVLFGTVEQVSESRFIATTAAGAIATFESITKACKWLEAQWLGRK